MDAPEHTNEPPVERTKKGPSGCVIALIVFGALAALAIIGAVVAVVMISRNPVVRDVVGAVGSAVNAPGRSELSDAGCEMAFVVDTSSLAKLARKYPEADATKGKSQEQQDVAFVTCAYATREPSLDCRQVLTVYLDAVAKPPSKVTVFVKNQRLGETVCSGIYDSATRERIGDVKVNTGSQGLPGGVPWREETTPDGNPSGAPQQVPGEKSP